MEDRMKILHEEWAVIVLAAALLLLLLSCSHKSSFEEVDTRCRNYSDGRPSDTYSNCMAFAIGNSLKEEESKRRFWIGFLEGMHNAAAANRSMTCSPSVMTNAGATQWRCQ
jgi:hypothetical protein